MSTAVTNNTATSGAKTAAEVLVYAVDFSALQVVASRRSNIQGVIEFKNLTAGRRYILVAGDDPSNAYQAVNSKIFTAQTMVWSDASNP